MYKNKAENGGNNICGQRIKEIRENLPEKTSQRKLADMCFLQALFPQKCRVTSSKLHGEFPQYCISPSGTLLGAGEEPLQAYKVY